MQAPMIKLIALTMLSVIANFATAQKLPTIQTGGLKAPVNIKIDGKATEWGDKFQAYNNHIEAFYTIANDSQNLYLIMKVPTHDIADKVIRGGVTVVINHTEKKNDTGAVSIKYPILKNGDQAAVANMYARKSFDQGDGTTTSANQMNAMFESRSKTIEISGIKAITDKEISIYNTEGIRAVGLFDEKNAYTYELAIPLKYLDLPNGGADGFSYRVKVNPPDMSARVSGNGPPPPPVINTVLGTTDFWGVYKLVK